MGRLQFREHYITGGTTAYSATDNSNFYIRGYDDGIEISAFHVFPRAWLNGKKVRYSRTIGGYTGAAQKYAWVEIMDGAYDRASSVHFPAGADRINLGNGRLVLVENTYADSTTSTITTGVLDLSGGSQESVSLCWRVRQSYIGRNTYFTVTACDILDSSNNVIMSLDIDAYTAEGTTSGQNYGYMGTFPAITAPVKVGLLQPAGLFTDHLVTPLDEVYWVYQAVQHEFVGLYGLSMSSTLQQPYRDAAQLESELYQPLSFGASIARPLRQDWGAALAWQATLAQPWSSSSALNAPLVQGWGISGGAVVQSLLSSWDLNALQPIMATNAQTWGMLGETTLIESGPAYTTTVSGVSFDPISISIEASLDQYSLSATLGIADLATYLACTIGSALEITVAGSTYSLRIEGRSRNREHGSAAYTVTALSPSAWLDAPYAETVTGEYSGMASAIAATIAAPTAISWQTVDWFIPAATLLPASETPLALIRKMAAAVGAVVQSDPDGTLRVIPGYPLRVPDWATSTPAAILSDLDDIFTSTETYDHRPGYNHYIISDELAAADTVRLEEESLDTQRKRIRGYRTPWQPVTLRHTGGNWVALVSMGAEEREELEVVEFVGGEGRTKYPIIDRLTMEWLEVELGTITQGEDGLLKSEIAAESLLSITYRTRCHLWEATSPQIEQVQFVAEVEAV
jgi:hypothetical protein